MWDGWSWSSSAVLDEVIFCLVRIYDLSCKALPITASRGVEVLVELHRKSGPRSTSTGRSHDVVVLHGKLRWGSKW